MKTFLHMLQSEIMSNIQFSGIKDMVLAPTLPSALAHALLSPHTAPLPDLGPLRYIYPIIFTWSYNSIGEFLSFSKTRSALSRLCVAKLANEYFANGFF